VSPMEASLALSLIDGALLEEPTPGSLRVSAPPEAHRSPVSLDGVAPALGEVLRELGGVPVTQSALAARALQAAGFPGFGLLQRFVALLERSAFLSRWLLLDGAPLAALHPVSLLHRWSEDAVQAGSSLRLSRFACCRRDTGGLLVESPLGHARVRLLAGPAFAGFAALAEARTPERLAEQVAGLGVDGARLLMALLNGAGALVAGDGEEPELADPRLAQWDFHDLLFHSRSRLGRHSNPFGGTYPHKGRFEPLPAAKPVTGRSLALPVPDLGRLQNEDRPFSAVLESRRSLREYGERPLSLAQLGELLYRAARVQKAVPEAGVSFRPHPAGGALHELEIYPVVSRCEGLPGGLYRYDAFGHQLESVAEPDRGVEALLRMAAATAGIDAPPQVLLVITARFQRIQWKYQSMAYALILKNVGALYQTLYLVAAAMGLAPTALGGGHSDLFATAAGLDYLAETSVGEFIVGSAHE
jgi:oxazoline/thiazoline dehydrogenase